MEYYQIPDFNNGIDVLNPPTKGNLSACLKTQNLIPFVQGVLRKRDGYRYVRSILEPFPNIEKVLCFKYYPDVNTWIVIVKYPQGQGNDRVFVEYNGYWFGQQPPWDDLGQVDGNYNIERFNNKFYLIDGLGQIRVIGLKLDNPSNKPTLTQSKGTLPEGTYNYLYCGVNGNGYRTIASPAASITIQKVPPPQITNALPNPYSQARCYGHCWPGMHRYKITSIIQGGGESLPSQEYAYNVYVLYAPNFTLTAVANGGSIPAGTYTYKLTGIKRVENLSDFAETGSHSQQITLSNNTSGVRIDIQQPYSSQSEIDYIRVYCNDKLIKVLPSNATTWTDTYDNRETQDISPPGVGEDNIRGIKITWEKPSPLVKGYNIYEYIATGGYGYPEPGFYLLTTIYNPDTTFYYDTGTFPSVIPLPTSDTTTGVLVEFEGIEGANSYKIYRNSYLIGETTNYYYNDENPQHGTEQSPSNNTTIPYCVLLKNTYNALNVPKGKYLKFFKDRLWVADDYNLYFSKNLIFNQFEASNVINLSTANKITGIEVITRNVLTQDIANFLFVGCENCGYIVAFGTALEYVSKIFDGKTVEGQNLITNCPFGLVFVSNDNVYVLDVSLNVVSIGDLISPILSGVLGTRARDTSTNAIKKNHLTFYGDFLRLSYTNSDSQRVELWASMKNRETSGWYGEHTLDFDCYCVASNKLYGAKNGIVYVFADASELYFMDNLQNIQVELLTKYYSCGNEYVDKLFKRFAFRVASLDNTTINVETYTEKGTII